MVVLNIDKTLITDDNYIDCSRFHVVYVNLKDRIEFLYSDNIQVHVYEIENIFVEDGDNVLYPDSIADDHMDVLDLQIFQEPDHIHIIKHGMANPSRIYFIEKNNRFLLDLNLGDDTKPDMIDIDKLSEYLDRLYKASDISYDRFYEILHKASYPVKQIIDNMWYIFDVREKEEKKNLRNSDTD